MNAVPVMRIVDVPQIAFAFRKAKRTLGLFGRPGIGKSDSIREAARYASAKLGHPVAVEVVHLASMSEVDVGGYLIPDGQDSHFTRPPYARAMDASANGILAFDEFAQASPECQKAVAPVLLDRRGVPDGWQVLVAGNRVEDNAGANDLLSHILNRIAYVQVELPCEDWVVWAATHAIDPLLIAHAKLHPTEVFEAAPPADTTPYCTPRSMHALSDVIGAMGGVDAALRSEAGQAVVAGMVGMPTLASLRVTAELASKLPNLHDIERDPMGVDVPKAVDEAYVVATMVAARATEKNAQALCAYLCRMDANITLMGVVMLINRMPAAGQYVTKWITDNRKLIGAYARFIH